MSRKFKSPSRLMFFRFSAFCVCASLLVVIALQRLGEPAGGILEVNELPRKGSITAERSSKINSLVREAKLKERVIKVSRNQRKKASKQEIEALAKLLVNSNLLNTGEGLTDKKIREVTDLKMRGADFNGDELYLLKYLPNLKVLEIPSNFNGDFSGLAELANLEELNLKYSQVSDTSILQGLKKLRVLDLSSTKLSDISALNGLGELR